MIWQVYFVTFPNGEDTRFSALGRTQTATDHLDELVGPHGDEEMAIDAVLLMVQHRRQTAIDCQPGRKKPLVVS